MSKRRQDGLYRRGYIFCFRYKDSDADWKEKSTGTGDRVEAKAFKGQFLEDLKQGRLPTDKAQWTVEQACMRWVEQHAAHLKSQKARSNEQSYLRQLVRRLGSRKVKSITLDVLKDYQRDRRREVKERPINLEMGILVNVLKESNLWRGPLLNYRRLSEPESEVGEALALDQLKRLETVAASNELWQVAYCAEVLAANTGMRGGEIKKLQLGAIDLERRRVRVTRKSTKTNAGARWVELNQAATAAVVLLYRRAELLGAAEPEHFLLPADLSRHTKASDPLRGHHGFDPTRHQISWDTAWRRVRRAAGLPNLRFHSLRHTFITSMAEIGTPLQVTQAIVGHMSDAITKHYTHISDKVSRSAVEMLDKIRERSNFVDTFADVPLPIETISAKLLQ
ncbi:MAG TPA: site-specific integrase [Terriglobales bacterium]|nr:site-specific integrase [Terriglobales bacterium]